MRDPSPKGSVKQWRTKSVGGHQTTMRASGRRCLFIANLMQSDRLLLKPEYLLDPSARQLVISASECEVNKVMVWVNKERSIELMNPRWNI